MARPSKSVKTMSKNLTKEEKLKRLNAEDKLKGASDKITSPKHLTKAQKQIFNEIIRFLNSAEILSNADKYVLTICAIAIDRLHEIEKSINQNMDLIYDKGLMRAKDKYTKDFFRCLNELSLSPQSRAKMANINTQTNKNEEDPLLKILRGDNDET